MPYGLDGSGSATRGVAIAKIPSVIAPCRSNAELIAIVHDGVTGKGMPAMPQLGDDNIKAVVRYLRLLQGVTGNSTPAVAAASAPLPTGTGAQDAQPAKAAAPVDAAGGAVVDVQQRSLNQKEIKDDWVSYNGDYTGRRYSSLAEVTPANVSHLAVKWTFHTTGSPASWR